jgi:IS605 OrfB family transposase
MKCAYSQAIKIIKSTRQKTSNVNYKKYQRIYYKCKKSNRNINNILDLKYSEWSRNRTFKNRVKMPIFNGNTIELNSDLVRIQDSKTSKSYDLWVRIGSVFGNRFSLILPTKKHKNFNKHLNNGFELRKSITLRKDILGHFYVDVFFEREDLKPTTEPVTCIGIDAGINKLLSCSNGEYLGVEIKQLLIKLNRRKSGSRNYNQTLKEIKDYIGQSINKIDFQNLDMIVMENLKNITRNTKYKTSKNLRKQLGHWNLNLLFSRIINKCEENRVLFELVSPEFTSQTCSSCGEIHKESRNGEIYKCINCGFESDSDFNASINILNRFLDGGSTVPHVQKAGLTNYV